MVKKPNNTKNSDNQEPINRHGKKVKKYTLLITFLLLPLHIHSAEKNEADAFICIPDYSTGYTIGKSNKWMQVEFNVEGMKYILKKKNGSWFWSDFGEKPHTIIDLCEPFNKKGFTSCKTREDEVLFNRNTLRFQIIRPYGYVVADFGADKDYASTPFYKIGTCSPL